MEEMQHYYKERIIEALNSMKSEKYLKMVFFFTRSCYKEEKKKGDLGLLFSTSPKRRC